MKKLVITSILLIIASASQALTYYMSCSIKYTYDAAGNRTQRVYQCVPLPDGTGGQPRLANPNKTNDVTTIESILFPNPSNGIFVLKTSQPVQDATVNVLDLSGRILKTFAFNGNQQEMDIRALAEGQYSLQFIMQNNTNVHKLIKVE
jgi:Secretion system C-terminal sorting domain